MLGSGWHRIVKGTVLSQFAIGANYTLSFTILPQNLVGDYGSILHSTINGTNISGPESRVPAIWFLPNSTKLHVRAGTNSSHNFGFDTPSLPMNQATNVTVTVSGGNMSVRMTGGINWYNQVATDPSR